MERSFNSAQDVYGFHLAEAFYIVDKANFEDGIRYLSIMGMVQTIVIAEDRWEEFDLILRLHFPDYYTDYKPFYVQG